MKYRQINPPFCEASQWNKPGDHPKVSPSDSTDEALCPQCGKAVRLHGVIDTNGVMQSVCPGDYILLTDFYYPLSPQVFLSNYVPLVSGDDKTDLEASKEEVAKALENLRARNKGATTCAEQRGHAVYKIREALHWITDAIKGLK